MLPFQLEFGRPSALMRIHSVVDRQFGVYLLQYDGVTFDNRYLPTSWQKDDRWHLAAYIYRGALSVGSQRFEEGDAFTAATDTLAPSLNPQEVVRTHGPSAILALRLRPPFFNDTFRGYLTRLPNVKSLPWDELKTSVEDPAKNMDRLPASFNRVIDGLRAEGVLDKTAPSPFSGSTGTGRVVSRIASTVFPTLSRLATRPTMVDLIARAQLTERQLLRNLLRVQEDFELFDRGWRPAILRWRVTAGALLLSSPDVSLSEAARLAGYSSVKAMARAFADSGLPSPSEVRERIGKDPVPTAPPTATESLL
ncbi:MAG: hypothetical protein U0174_06765 [Polyangiaceae bacterium]